jgi:hypothetical protein
MYKHSLCSTHRAGLKGGPSGQLPRAPDYRLSKFLKSDFHTERIFSENHMQPGHVLSRILDSLIPGRKVYRIPVLRGVK